CIHGPDQCVLEGQTRHLDMELLNERGAGSERPMMLNRSGATSVIRTVCWMFLCSTRFVVTDGLNCSISVVGARVAFPAVHIQFAPPTVHKSDLLCTVAHE